MNIAKDQVDSSDVAIHSFASRNNMLDVCMWIKHLKMYSASIKSDKIPQTPNTKQPSWI